MCWSYVLIICADQGRAITIHYFLLLLGGKGARGFWVHDRVDRGSVLSLNRLGLASRTTIIAPASMSLENPPKTPIRKTSKRFLTCCLEPMLLNFLLTHTQKTKMFIVFKLENHKKREANSERTSPSRTLPGPFYHGAADDCTCNSWGKQAKVKNWFIVHHLIELHVYWYWWNWADAWSMLQET